MCCEGLLVEHCRICFNAVSASAVNAFVWPLAFCILLTAASTLPQMAGFGFFPLQRQLLNAAVPIQV